MHINKVTKTKAAIDVSPPQLSSRHKMIQEKQEKKRKQMFAQKKKNKRYVYEHDIENNKSILSVPARLEILKSTMKSSDTRKKVKDVSQQPVFSTVPHKFDFDEDEIEDEDSQIGESEIFIVPQDYSMYASSRQSSMMTNQSTGKQTSSLQLSSSLTGPQSARTSQTPTREEVLSRIDYSIIPGMHIIDEILKVELSDDTSTDDDENDDDNLSRQSLMWFFVCLLFLLTCVLL